MCPNFLIQTIKMCWVYLPNGFICRIHVQFHIKIRIPLIAIEKKSDISLLDADSTPNLPIDVNGKLKTKIQFALKQFATDSMWIWQKNPRQIRILIFNSTPILDADYPLKFSVSYAHTLQVHMQILNGFRCIWMGQTDNFTAVINLRKEIIGN